MFVPSPHTPSTTSNRTVGPSFITPQYEKKMSGFTSFAADWEDTMLHSCLSEEVEVSTRKQIKYGKLKNAGGDDHHEMADAINQSSLTQSSSESSFTSYEEIDDDDQFASDTDDSDISLCRARKFGQELDVNDNLSLQHANGTATDLVDTGECVTTSLANLFFGSEEPCNLQVEVDHENTSTLPSNQQGLNNNNNNNKRTSSNQRISRPRPILKKSSMKQFSILSNCKLNPRKRNVTFDRVDVREYEVSISYNPACSEGPPVELGWPFREAPPVTVDNYEKARSPKRRMQEIVLSESTRRRMLLERGGYTRQDLKEAIREVEHIKRQRILTYMMLPASALDEAAEEMFTAMTSAFKFAG